jgi:3-hydroxyisobutyrate dehydrogenase-like beta-hydroxyacid dehydrogenase
MAAQTLGFIGLGNMGAPIARNLLAAGHALRVYNRSADTAAAFVAGLPDDATRARVTLAASPADALPTPDGVVLSIVSNDAALEAITTGPGGLLPALAAAGGVHVCLSTVSPGLTDRLAAAHAAAGAAYVACPVFGRPTAAAAAKLIAVPAGPPGAVDRVAPLLAATAQKVVRAGDKPSGASHLKLAGNFMILATVEACAEAFALAEAAGVDRGAAYDALAGPGGIFASLPIMASYGRMVADGAFEPVGFTAANGLKDATLIADAMAEGGVDAPLAALLRARLAALNAAPGGPQRDWASFAAGIRPAAPKPQ